MMNILTGKYKKGQEPPKDGRIAAASNVPGMRAILNESSWNKLAKLDSFAAERGHSVGELAVAWLLAKPWLASVIAGARKPEQVTANVAAAKWKLTADETKTVDAITG